MYLTLLSESLAVFMTLLAQTAGHKMAALTVVFSQLSNADFQQTGREINDFFKWLFVFTTFQRRFLTYRKRDQTKNYCMSICLFIIRFTSTGAIYVRFICFPFYQRTLFRHLTFSSCRERWCSHSIRMPSRDVNVRSRNVRIMFSSCTRTVSCQIDFQTSEKTCFGSTSTRMETVNLFLVLWGLTQTHIHTHKKKKAEDFLLAMQQLNKK